MHVRLLGMSDMHVAPGYIESSESKHAIPFLSLFTTEANEQLTTSVQEGG